ncbi:MAG: hypothetical protein BWY65_02234 [Firmicutes bacterium ADurb.Bin373]|nr:MAG: hypothetical protein BWY65_02234 [Firmicutes bacterium ADurb.Bin373]
MDIRLLCRISCATEIIPPAIAPARKAIKTYSGPLQAPTTPSNFTSPAPMPPMEKGIINSAVPSARPLSDHQPCGNPPDAE